MLPYATHLWNFAAETLSKALDVGLSYAFHSREHPIFSHL